MRRVLVLLTLLGLALVPTDADADGPAGLFQILTGFAAQETCSCAFVVGQTDAYCTAIGQEGGLPVNEVIDHTAQTVTATSNGVTRIGRFGATGCTVDPL